MKKLFLLMAVVVLSIGALSGCASDKEVLNVYNWGDYIDESILKDFEEEYGITVNYEMFATNEDMYVKLKQGGTAYDVVFPSDYMIEKMIKEDMLLELDKSQMENYSYVMDAFKGLDYDPTDAYSVPYMWGTVGIVYNKTMVDDPVDSWEILWNKKYEKQILMMDSQRDTLMVALKALGYSMNTRNMDELEQAKQLLIEQKPLVLAYVGDNVKDMMLAGEAALAVVWSGEAVTVMQQDENLAFAYPKEGTNLWFDSVVIPKGAQNPEAAHKFIDFLNRPEIALRNTDYIGYSTPNSGALELVKESLRNNVAYYPDVTAIGDLEVFKDPGTFIEEYNRVWTELKAH